MSCRHHTTPAKGTRRREAVQSEITLLQGSKAYDSGRAAPTLPNPPLYDIVTQMHRKRESSCLYDTLSIVSRDNDLRQRRRRV
jgi:hypothetical protein